MMMMLRYNLNPNNWLVWSGIPTHNRCHQLNRCINMETCMCDRQFKNMVNRKNEDMFCEDCNEKHCEHNNTETISIPGTYEAITICHDCGCEV